MTLNGRNALYTTQTMPFSAAKINFKEFYFYKIYADIRREFLKRQLDGQNCKCLAKFR